MAISYPRMRATAKRLLTENGTTWKVIRPGKVSVVAGVEHTQLPFTFDAVGVRSDYKPFEVDGTTIQGGDVRIVFTADAELLVGDVVEVDGRAFRIVEPNPVKPSTLVLCYRAQLRA